MSEAAEIELPTAEEMVARYIAYRDYITAEKAKFEEHIAKYKQAMTTLEACAALLMAKTKQRGLSTTAGTAFQKTHTRIKCTNRKEWLDFVWAQALAAETEEDVEAAWSGITAHINTDFVESWMANHEGQPPPGVGVERFVKVEFRKA